MPDLPRRVDPGHWNSQRSSILYRLTRELLTDCGFVLLPPLTGRGTHPLLESMEESHRIVEAQFLGDLRSGEIGVQQAIAGAPEAHLLEQLAEVLAFFFQQPLQKSWAQSQAALCPF